MWLSGESPQVVPASLGREPGRRSSVFEGGSASRPNFRARLLVECSVFSQDSRVQSSSVKFSEDSRVEYFGVKCSEDSRVQSWSSVQCFVWP